MSSTPLLLRSRSAAITLDTDTQVRPLLTRCTEATPDQVEADRRDVAALSKRATPGGSLVDDLTGFSGAELGRRQKRDRARLDALERSRWPLPSVVGATGIVLSPCQFAAK